MPRLHEKPFLWTQDNRKDKNISSKTGGATVFPSVLGCWKDDKTGELVCEENIMITTVIDSETAEDFDKKVNETRELIKNTAKKYGQLFGQESVLEGENVTEVSFVSGEFKKEIPKHLRGINFFEKLI